MSELKWHWREKLYTPSTYVANAVDPVFAVKAGDMVGVIICRTVEAFDGTGTAAKFELGDGNDADRYLDDGELEETSVSAATSVVRAIGASGGTYVLYRNFLYGSDDTIDVNFTAATGADGTTGKVRIKVAFARQVEFQ